MAMKMNVERDQLERFIKIVEANPALYNPFLDDHRDIRLLHKTWAAIAKAMDDKQYRAEDWKKKWKNLRDSYIKARRGVKVHRPGHGIILKKSKWKWLGVMSFLDPILDSNTNSNSTDAYVPDPDTDTQSTESEQEASLDMECVSLMETSDSLSSAPTYECVSPMGPPVPAHRQAKNAKRKRYEKEEGKADPPAFDPPAQDPPNTNTSQLIGQMAAEPVVQKTAEDLFFESCASRIKQLPPQTKSFLHLQISQLFHNAENPDLPPVPITPLPSHHHGFNLSDTGNPHHHPLAPNPGSLVQPHPSLNPSSGAGDMASTMMPGKVTTKTEVLSD